MSRWTTFSKIYIKSEKINLITEFLVVVMFSLLLIYAGYKASHLLNMYLIGLAIISAGFFIIIMTSLFFIRRAAYLYGKYYKI